MPAVPRSAVQADATSGTYITQGGVVNHQVARRYDGVIVDWQFTSKLNQSGNLFPKQKEEYLSKFLS